MEKSFNINELTLRDITRSLFRQKLVIILIFIIVMCATFVILNLQTPVYEASVTMYIKGSGQTEASTYQAIAPFRIHITQMEIVKSEPVLNRVVATLKLDERPDDYELKFASKLKKQFVVYMKKIRPENKISLNPEKEKELKRYNAIQHLKKNLRTVLIPNTDIFHIIVTDYDPEIAKSIANVVSRSYTIFDQQQQLAEISLKFGFLHPMVQQLQDNINLMEKDLSGERLPDLEALGTASVKIIEQASSTGIPVGKSKKMILMISVFVAIFLGMAFALFIDIFDQTFRSPDDILNFVKIPVLGSIPKRKFREKLFLKDASGPTKYTVFYEDLADQIYIFLKTQNLKTILIASPMQRELNSAIVPNLGHLFSKQMHHKTLIVDCNLRNPVYDSLLGLSLNPGLANLIEDENIDSLIQKVDTDFDAIASGKTTMNPMTLMNKFNINETLGRIKDDYEIVLLDCTNIKNFNEIVMLSPHTDGVIFVINEGRDRKQVVKSAVAPVKLNQANIIGGILNNRTFKIPEVIYKRI